MLKQYLNTKPSLGQCLSASEVLENLKQFDKAKKSNQFKKTQD